MLLSFCSNIIEVCDSELDTLFIKDCYIDCLKLWWFSFSHDANYNASYKGVVYSAMVTFINLLGLYWLKIKFGVLWEGGYLLIASPDDIYL